ncbi:MAG TPA: hypothetical protein VEB43_10245 [Anaeromyxobacter sp.]|nr:hypothetical protein [Anaeromyxobacter sp.]
MAAGRELRARPLLRAALREGRVGYRAAEVVLPLAVAEAERSRASRRRSSPPPSSVPTVPGCSHAATGSHHLVYRSRGGDLIDPANQTAVCEVHHHRCIHAGYLRVCGQAPDELTWMRGGKVFRGGVE